MTITDQQPNETRSGGGLAGRVALVTGGTAGIGAAISQSLADAGAAVAAGYRHNPERAGKFQASLAASVPGCRFTLHEGNIGLASDLVRPNRPDLDAA